MKNNKRLKTLVGVLTLALVFLSAASGLVYADQTADTQDAASSEETVYILTDANGKEHQRIVNDKGALCYEGYENAQVPVTMDITYKLDGKKISAEKLAGKSGHLTMTLDYTNHKKQGGVYVPFLAVCGMVMDNEIFSDVEVVNGKIIDDGNHQLVIGYALPGVQQSLGTSEINVPDSVTVNCQVEKFQLDTIYNFVSSEVFTEMNLDSGSSIADLTKNLDKLTDGIDQLLEGTGALYDGAEQLSDGADLLMEGTNSLASGIDELCNGTSTLKDGALQLKSGADGLASGADALAAGAKQLDDGAAQLNGGLSQLTAQSSTLNSGAQQIVASVFASANQSLSQAGLDVTVNAENYAQVLDGAAAQMPQAGEQLMNVKAQLSGVLQFAQGIAAYTSGVDSAAAGAAQIAANTGSLAYGAEELATGARTLSDGQNQVTSGIDQLSQGAKKLSKGAGVLAEKEKEFIRGVKQLEKGTKELNAGVKEMAEQVNSQLSALSKTDLKAVMNHIREMENAAKSYSSFRGDEKTDSVKFIYKTDAVTVEK